MQPPPPPSADVLVIGGGVAGLSVARLLAEGGARVVLAEAATIGHGASGLGHGQVLLGLIEHPHSVLAALGLDRSRQLYALGEASRALLASWGMLEQQGGWWIADDAREAPQLQRSADALHALGLRAELRDAEVVAGATGLQRGGPGLWLPDEATVDPRAALAALARAARAAGATICEQARVQRVTQGSAGPEAHLGDHVLTTELVVYAGGAALAELDPFFGDKLAPVREQALRCAGGPVPGPGGRAGYGYTWWRPRGGQLEVGGCRWATPHLEVGETRPEVVEAVQHKLEAFAARLAGPAPTIASRRAWIEAHSCDGLPLIGPMPGTARHVVCAGFCGNDWGLAPGAAQAVAGGLLGEGQGTVPALFAATRFL